MSTEQAAPLPSPPTESIWARGSRTVTQAQAETGLSRQELWELMNTGRVRWFAHGGRGPHKRRLLCWGDIVDFLDGLHQEPLETAGTGARTCERRE
jgi:hypothetical protein